MSTTPIDLRKEIFEAIGAASMCWIPIPEGVFDSTRAAKIGEDLCAKISALPRPQPLKAEYVYEAHYNGPGSPPWVTREVGGQYVAYHYIEEAAKQMADALNDRSRLRAFLVRIEGNKYCALHCYPPGECPSCLATEALKL